MDTPSRRAVLRAALAIAIAGAMRPGTSRAANPRFVGYPFTLGIASGAPRPDGVTLWTRLAPAPLDPSGGLFDENVLLTWEVALDERFERPVQKGEITAFPEHAHSVRVDVRGLEPARWYFYRFLAGSEASPVGRTRTADALGSSVARLKLGVTSCQHFEHGWFVAHRHLLAEQPDLVLFLGDYIYEKSISGDNLVRRHSQPETYTLDDYRIRHAQTKTDPDLQALHAAVPCESIWDDHEVDNDWAGDQSEHLDPRFLQRRAAAFQAYLEHLPIPATVRLERGGVRLYKNQLYGDLAHLVFLDDRQYRSPQVCASPAKMSGSFSLPASECPELVAPERTLLGKEQSTWFDEAIQERRARWTIVAQQTLVAPASEGTGPDRVIWTDGWSGYPNDRAWLLQRLKRRKVENPIVVGGDIHATVVADLHEDPEDVSTPIIASELCATSVTSPGDLPDVDAQLLLDNPHLRYANRKQRGYLVLELSPERCDARVRVVDEKNKESGVETAAAFVVEAGRPGPLPA